MVVPRLFLGQPRRGNGNERESRTRPDGAHGPAPARRRRQLPPGIVSHNAQIHVAVHPGVAARMGTKKINRAHLASPANGSKTLCQRLATARKAGRQIVQQQFHNKNLTGSPTFASLLQSARLARTFQNGLRQCAGFRGAVSEDAVDVIQIGREFGAFLTRRGEMIPIALEQAFF